MNVYLRRWFDYVHAKAVYVLVGDIVGFMLTPIAEYVCPKFYS